MFETDQHTERTVVYMKKRVIKIFKRAGISIVIICTVMIILAFGTYVYNSICLKKEAALIDHKGL